MNELHEKKKLTIQIRYIFIAILLAVLQVILLNNDSTSGEQLTSFTREVDRLANENSRLRQEIASASALIAVSAQAQLYGYTEQKEIVSLTSPLPVAFTIRNNL